MYKASPLRRQLSRQPFDGLGQIAKNQTTVIYSISAHANSGITAAVLYPQCQSLDHRLRCGRQQAIVRKRLIMSPLVLAPLVLLQLEALEHFLLLELVLLLQLLLVQLRRIRLRHSQCCCRMSCSRFQRQPT
jgi:hypothetical protein